MREYKLPNRWLLRFLAFLFLDVFLLLPEFVSGG
jgi:hypothetical protein